MAENNRTDASQSNHQDLVNAPVPDSARLARRGACSRVGSAGIKTSEREEKGRVEKNRAARKKEETESPAVPHSLDPPEDGLG